MSWEAFRLTSKSPSEVMTILGPHGVDDLIRHAISDCWREYPEETRTFLNVKKRVEEVFERNMRVWTRIKKPTPAAFFEDLLPYAADGHVRQALVLCWMMLPRAGGRNFSDVARIVRRIYERNLEAWEQDHLVFTRGSAQMKKRKRSAALKKVSKKATRKPAPRKSSRKR